VVTLESTHLIYYSHLPQVTSDKIVYVHREIPDLWNAPIQGITISESSQLSSVSQLGCSHPVSPLRSKIALAQSWVCANVLCSLKIGCAILRLARNFGILRMRSAISRLRKFLDCTEHIHVHVHLRLSSHPSVTSTPLLHPPLCYIHPSVTSTSLLHPQTFGL